MKSIRHKSARIFILYKYANSLTNINNWKELWVEVKLKKLVQKKKAQNFNTILHFVERSK